MRILIIEDNQDIAANLADYLENQGHTIDAAADGITGLHMAVVNEYEVIILDLMLPGMDGIDVCKKIRTEALKQTPILMLTARDTVEDKLNGFSVGADDYLVKPFSMRELHARLQILSRRQIQPFGSNKLRVADLELDLGTMEVHRGSELIDLAPIGKKLLEELMRSAPKLVRRQKLEHVIWGDIPPDSDALRAHMHNLRRLIDKPFNKQLLQTERGLGYRLVDPDAISS
ncbi:MAG: response regulator transcription factor [Gammaproteobacteria bacterium]|nr:response regulator transcription factor [Gammaproteobacteria bacterium]MCW8988134.1 response regulator transcription factor [Gammaproteobacteria bacterium]MCW9032311.1 response regulator transcription factor [Gammaproteobacteria bacterium]